MDNKARAKVINEFVEFARQYTHTVGEQGRLVLAAGDFLKPPVSLSKRLKKSIKHD